MSVAFTLDWHWDEPLWPLARLGTPQATDIARLFTVRRCFWCGLELIGPGGDSLMALHMEQEHVGHDVLYTSYPPAMGLEQRGSGRDA